MRNTTPGINGKQFKIKLNKEWYKEEDKLYPLYVFRYNNKIFSHKNKNKWLIKILLFLKIIKVYYYTTKLY